MYRIRYLLIAAAVAIISVVTAQKSYAEQKYWLDGTIVEAQEPTPGNATIDISALSTGPHWLTIISQNEAGVWSSPVTKGFIVPYESADGKSIVEHQYWIDGKLEASVTQSQQPSVISIEALRPGIHSFTVRVKDNTGTWSSHVAKYFIVPYNEPGVGDKSIVEHQYWIDGKLEAKVSQNEKPSIINISTLKPGLHSLTVRVKDNTGTWSSQTTRYFVMKEEGVVETTITHGIYWFDDDLVNAKAVVLDSEAGDVDIDIKDIEGGTHTLWWRCTDSKGALSDARSVSFEKKSYATFTVPSSGMGTFSTNTPVQVPDGLRAYYCRSEMKNKNGLGIFVRYVEGDVIDANTGVLLSGTPGATYQLYYTTEAGVATESNTLVPVVESTDVSGVDGEYANFVMEGGEFVKIDGTAKLPANSAYLHLPVEIVGNATKIVIDYGIITGVDTPEVDYKTDRFDNIYNLNGQRMSEPLKGVNIINGRKVIIKR